VEWAGWQVINARRAATEAKAAKDAADALVEGLRAGTYGDITIGPRSRKMPDYKASFERLIGLYALPDVHRPPVEEVEAPEKRTDRWVEVKPVRAAKRGRNEVSS
jgi:hypothetical protein